MSAVTAVEIAGLKRTSPFRFGLDDGWTIAFAVVARAFDTSLEESGDRDQRARNQLSELASSTEPRLLSVILLLPGAMTVYMAVNSGGVFPVTTALGCLIVLTMMLAALVCAGKAPCMPSRAVLLPACLFALLAAWTLLSSGWSHAPGRAQEAFVRVLLYLLTFTLLGLVPRSVRRMGLLLRGILVGIAAVAVLALLSRLVPSIVLVHPALEDQRLNYPITYWNSLGMLLGLGCVLALHHTSDENEPRTVRVLAAASLPLLGSALLLTFSRGAIAAGAVGLVIYLVVAHPRGLIGGLLASVPPVAVALTLTDHATVLQSGSPWSQVEIAQGHRLAIELGICSIGAGAIRLALLPLDARLRMWSGRWPRGPRLRMLLGVAGIAMLCGGIVALHVPARLHTQYEHFVEDRQPSGSASERLLYVGNDGRLPLWHVALAAYRADPMIGTGAGTYRLDWERRQQGSYDRVYGYSIYLETLGELGLIGAILLGGALLAILVGAAMSARRRPVYAAAFAVIVAWLIHAGVDLDWQTPAVTLPVMAMAGAVLARPAGTGARGSDGLQTPRKSLMNLSVRPALALLCLLAAVIPSQVALAQSYSDAAVTALGKGDCRRASDKAHAAISATGAEATPYVVLAICAAREGHPLRALGSARTAVSRDPGNWQTHYALALVEGAAGIDPESQARIAREDYPAGRLAGLAVTVFRSHSPRRWKTESRALPLALED